MINDLDKLEILKSGDFSKLSVSDINEWISDTGGPCWPIMKILRCKDCIINKMKIDLGCAYKFKEIIKVKRPDTCSLFKGKKFGI